MVGLSSSIKRVVAGKELRKIEFPVSGGKARVLLALKETNKDGGRYAVLGLKASGNYQYIDLELDELEQLADTANEIRELAGRPEA